MVVVSFEIYAEVSGVGFISNTGAVVGFSVDRPLPDKIAGTEFAKGIIGVSFAGVNLVVGSYGPVTIPVTVNPGVHYVILGIDFGALVSIITGYRLRLRGLGVTVDRTFNILSPKQYVYIAFNVDKNNNVSVVGSGVIAPGSAPVAVPSPSGSSVVLPTNELGEIIATTTQTMLEFMMPIMFMNMLFQMIFGLMNALVGGIGVMIR